MLALRAHEKILGKAEKVFNDQLGLVDFLTLTLQPGTSFNYSLQDCIFQFMGQAVDNKHLVKYSQPKFK